jgi:hypothetical protein
MTTAVADKKWTRLSAPFDVRVFSRIERGDGCWPWRGGISSSGYGNLNVPGTRRKILAHRAVYELTFGPIPDGLLVLHRCDNPRCVRPEHLFLGTHRENAHDKIRKGRAPWQRR